MTLICESDTYACPIVDIDGTTPPEALPCTVRTFVRPLDRFPPNFEARAGHNGKGVISAMKNERMLLNNLLGQFALATRRLKILIDAAASDLAQG